MQIRKRETWHGNAPIYPGDDDVNLICNDDDMSTITVSGPTARMLYELIDFFPTDDVRMYGVPIKPEGLRCLISYCEDQDPNKLRAFDVGCLEEIFHQAMRANSMFTLACGMIASERLTPKNFEKMIRRVIFCGGFGEGERELKSTIMDNCARYLITMRDDAETIKMVTSKSINCVYSAITNWVKECDHDLHLKRDLLGKLLTARASVKLARVRDPSRREVLRARLAEEHRCPDPV